MKYLKTIVAILVISLINLTIISCKDAKKENTQDSIVHSEMNHNKMDKSNNMMDDNSQNSGVQKVLADYMILKDALVETDKNKAAKAGDKLNNTLSKFEINGFTVEQQKELKDIITDAKEHAEHIGRSEIDHQREHFKTLSKDIMDMVAITGTKNTLYQQFCPMYDGGSAWLSLNKEIKNPYYGSKMLKCGKVQKEIN
ncbi:DUF3347 domain-containing protein [Tenacibaculum sp. HL-MS23]|uniref:DUF3347 domain-containing protein n=1 Tax=Tenacibaculum soleae TaxID=447689 RepID=A0A1B9XZP8_9FLAO|nr:MULTISPECIES: DUF3347 domain-containing protein [Flavobacteriaceae]MBU2940744.1 DUF3347 domain-containing protein [Lacinutrix sp. C3R15]MDO6624062.1 DUF3347 domain-containing protein [Oceanihabitans sp. 1_MG-2023]OCK43012.1 hypothetical protein BA195_08960 [Tenacibaculum soleae]WNW01707.1 DUF3347 domain-containing protein [Tenacibaculum sp. HL-MS23]